RQEMRIAGDFVSNDDIVIPASPIQCFVRCRVPAKGSNDSRKGNDRPGLGYGRLKVSNDLIEVPLDTRRGRVKASRVVVIPNHSHSSLGEYGSESRAGV